MKPTFPLALLLLTISPLPTQAATNTLYRVNAQDNTVCKDSEGNSTTYRTDVQGKVK